MEPPSEHQKASYLRDCMDGRKACFWPNLFGLRQLSQRRCRQGPRGLVGVLAGFQGAANEDIDAFASRFDCKSDMKEAIANDPDIAEEITKNCLARYGSTIWSSNSPYTNCDDSYPHQLDFCNAVDKAWIQLYVSCWMIHLVYCRVGIRELEPNLSLFAGARRPRVQSRHGALQNHNAAYQVEELPSNQATESSEEDPVEVSVESGPSQSLQVESAAQQSAAQSPSLIIKRKRLALQLLQVLQPEIPDLTVLHGLAAPVKLLRVVDDQRLRQCFGDVCGPLSDALDQWLELLDILVNFQEAASFDCGRRSWDQHLRSLQQDSRVSALALEREASIATQLWISKQRNFTVHWCSAQVVKALVAMAQWKETPDEETTRKIMDRLLQCNKSLVAWFD